MNHNNFSQHNNDMPSIRELLTVLFDRKKSLFIVFFSTIGLTIVLVYGLLSPKFESNATLLINFTDVTRPIVNAPPKSDFEKVTDFHTQKDILESVKIATQTVIELNLAEHRVIGNLEKMKIGIRNIKIHLGELFDVEKWTKPWDKETAAISALMKHLDIKTSPESKAVKISYRSHSPTESADTLLKIIEIYETFYYQQIKQEASGILSYIEARIEAAHKNLIDSETDIYTFKTQNSHDSQTNQLDYSTLGITDSIEVQDQLNLYILRLEEELRQLSTRLSNNDPTILELKEKLQNMVASVNAIPKKELALQRLNRQQQLAQDKYLLLAKNLEQAKLIAFGQANHLGLIQMLEKPEADEKPVSPKRRLILILSIFLASGLSLAWIYICQFFDRRIGAPDEFKRFHDIPCLGSMEEVKAA